MCVVCMNVVQVGVSVVCMYVVCVHHNMCVVCMKQTEFEEREREEREEHTCYSSITTTTIIHMSYLRQFFSVKMDSWDASVW